MDIGQRIKSAREKQKLSMNALAKLSGAAQSAISEIEAGGRQPSFELLERIVTGLGYTLSDFFATQEVETLSPALNQTIAKLKRLTPRQIKILNDVLDEWLCDKQ